MRSRYTRELEGVDVAVTVIPFDQTLAIIRELKGIDFAGMDAVKVSPPYDHNEITSNAAAMIAIEMLCLKAWARAARASVY